MQQPRQTIVAFNAARLGIESVLLLALPGELLLDGPRTRPQGRVFDCNFVGEGPWAGTGPTLDQVQILARSKYIGFRTEVGHVDHKRVALPMAARVAEPLTDARRQVGAPVHDDVALPPLALIHVVEDRDAAGRLHDAAEAAAEEAAELGQPAVQAAVCQAIILRTIAAIETHKVAGVVARRRLRESRRGRRIVLASGTRRLLVLARVCGLQQSEAKFPVGRSRLLRLRRLRRNPAIGRIDNERRACTDVLYGQKRRVVGTADVDRGSALLTRVVAVKRSALFV